MKFTGFQQLLYRKFLIERRWRVDEIAQALGVDRSTMYQWVDGVRTCPYDIIPHLFLVTRDLDFLTFGLQGTGYTVAPLPTAEVDAGRLETETLDVARAAGQFVAVVQDRMQDGRVDRQDAEAIGQACRDLQREAEEARAVANGMATRQGLKVVGR